jgi:acyl-CoA reductase-like NAD-dependent aldehyde dehydrogenase
MTFDHGSSESGNIPPDIEAALPFLRGGAKRLLIGGRWREASAGGTFDTVNPATARKIVPAASAEAADIDQAVSAARKALESKAWAGMNPHERTRNLLRIANAIDDHAEELAGIETINVGMPITIARRMIAGTADVFRYYAGWATKIYGETNPSAGGVFNFTLREPVGVCGAIIPWNGPIASLAWKVAPALACGATVVLKPAEQTPLSAVRFGEILLDCDLPPGIVNIVTGFGHSAGAALVRHPGVDKISFTGSTAVGEDIMKSAACGMKRVTLELGGKSPNIIFADADIDAAVDAAVAAFCALSGQRCIAGTRIFVQRAIHDDVARRIAEVAAAYPIGDPQDERTLMGPLASDEHFRRVTSYFEIARRDGAALAAGGTAMPGPGYFVNPTLYTGVDNTMRVAREEIFGPVACIIPFADEEDVLQAANDSEFGLAAAVWTRDFSRAHRMARRLKAGTVGINCYAGSDPVSPFGGYKRSGIGREFGRQSLDAYTEVKSVFANVA